MGAGTQDWLDRELAGSSFVDERLGKRLRKLVELKHPPAQNAENGG
jgi:hypothetical protein